jgi:hypothetical protein
MSDERFWAKVDRTGDCWVWLAGKGRGGYGRLSRAGLSPQYRLAHRHSWELAYGPIPDGLHVCHRCDNPPCVNPAHLFLGTDKDNLDDMRSKGRGTQPPVHAGLAQWLATVPDADVRAARESYAAGAENSREIGERLGVKESTVRKWIAGRARRDAGGPMRAAEKRAAA